MRPEVVVQTTDSIDAEGYRANVGIILMRENGELFLGGRPGGRGWQFPQGGIRPDEKTEDALYRELNEEVGLRDSDVKVLGSTRAWLRYRLPPQYVRRNAAPVCIGQKQRWFLLRFEGTEDRFRFDATNEPEFDRWRWVPFWTPVREVIYFKRRVYTRALHELGPLGLPDGLPPYPEWWSNEVGGPSGKPPRRHR